MCGFVGVLSQLAIPDKKFEKMLDKIKHRGPNNIGIWKDNNISIVLGHRRLSILDTSNSGNQPMVSEDNNFILVYNGEIYNHIELRNELKSDIGEYSWNSESDTETLLMCIQIWGLTKTLQNLNGMFAFAVWDKQKLQLTLARDRFGEKPLYYGKDEENFVFGSQLSACKSSPSTLSELDRDAINLYMKFGCVPGHFSIYKAFKKLLPGHFLVLNKFGKAISEPTSYFSLGEEAIASLTSDVRYSRDESISKLNELMLDSTKSRMISDVPLGAFLSGGIDSSLIVSCMNKVSHKPVKTFSIGNKDTDYNEAHHAAKVAKYLGTEHTELYVTPENSLEIIPNMAQIYDEPFADSSQIPTYLVSKMAKESVTVALSGDGGDELFGGYNRHIFAKNKWPLINNVPSFIRKGLYNNFDILLKNPLVKSILQLNRVPQFEQKLSKISKVMMSNSNLEFYLATRENHNTENLCITQSDFKTMYSNTFLNTIDDISTQMMLWDTQSYLPDDILVKVDRASMACSLEVRAPFLDLNVFRFAWNINSDQRIQGNVGKKILRDVLALHLPTELTDRPKQGFAIPIGAWLRGDLRSWASDLLNKDRMIKQGIFNADLAQKLWVDHLELKSNNETTLWSLLMFQSWLMHNKIA
ncbi:asparagine synthase (glutamine-hydrolyzing) [Amylibacter sp.]|nr:asparagine synthase (glutamine-hydrolyzing) [Amylibacter sp.]